MQNFYHNQNIHNNHISNNTSNLRVFNRRNHQHFTLEDNEFNDEDGAEDDLEDNGDEENIDNNIQHTFSGEIEDDSENFDCDDKETSNRLFRENFCETSQNYDHFRNSITSQSNHSTVITDRQLLIL